MFEFNGQTKEYIHSIQDIVTHYGPARSVERQEVPGGNGAVLRRISDGEKTIELQITIMPRSGETFQDVADDMVRWLYHDEPKRLELPDNPGRYYDAMIVGGIDRDEIIYFAKCTLTFVVLDGVSYSTTPYENTAISDVVDVVNEGTADTDMIVEATALENSTMFMITKGDDDYFMVGRPVDAFKGEVDDTPTVWLARDTTFHTFTPRTDGDFVGDGNLTGQYVSGHMYMGGADGNKVMAKYGDPPSGATWHGPVYRRSLYGVAEDFYARSAFQALQIDGKGVGKAFIHLYDDAGDKVASFGFVESLNVGSNVRAVVRLYTSDGGYEEIFHSAGDAYDRKFGQGYDGRWFWISLERTGNQYTVKTWSNYEENGIMKVTSVATATYNDNEGLFARNIVMADMAMAKHVNYPALDSYIFWARVRQKLHIEDAVPYLIKKGDEILIDTKQSLVLLNDEPITSEKDFGSNYFKIDKGLNRLLIEPQGRFDTTVKWYDRYL